MTENIKKTKGFVETPAVITQIMHFYLDLDISDKLLDLTAGKGALFLNHPTYNCFGCEIDTGNYSILQEKNYTNIIKGDVFEVSNQIGDESMDSLILNPPYGKLQNGKNSVDIMNLALNKLKEGGKFAIINQSNYSDRFSETLEYFKNNTQIEYASIFDTELFKPFANVKTLLICGIKGKSEKQNTDVWVFDNDKIIVNKRSKFVDIKLLKPEEKTILSSKFWEKINTINQKPVEPPTLADFKKTIIDFMAWESGLPREMIENPKLLSKALSCFRNKK
jgi:tRNA1(Val) A37 N6-methylase TrmN6